MDFVTIDFETAAADRSSPCEIGLTFVENNQIIRTISWLIKPHCYPNFDYFNILIHGITPDMVDHAAEFNEIWKEIHPLIEGKLLFAHNASFDFSVLRKTLDVYDLPYPNITYACSYIMAKNIWTGLSSYNLKSLCNQHHIQFDHHRAAADSKATAELILIGLMELDIVDHDGLRVKSRLDLGNLSAASYRPCRTLRTYAKPDFSAVADNTSHHDADSPFYQRHVVFTGKLSSMERSFAQKIVLTIGGRITDGVTRDTNYLIVGHQDYRYVGEDGMSSKQKKAIAMVNTGADLEILSEDDFLKSVDGKWDKITFETQLT
ncbi:DNA polymerase-3 subunit epsilon [Mucilaginibacter pineti]|uniref:DNA polymerase-3 subunit epsilon n=1 Tax=Mucilaginibacter pineti TaxID=1391627 RepID=A0A1G7ILE7_9SPHI|nr:exonuclease domain-containing protein [Mucilaginibacter pineti]SDF13374.1 DNA polymerase-3 subunit epsilon [Mucilaginibacter pineti]